MTDNDKKTWHYRAGSRNSSRSLSASGLKRARAETQKAVMRTWFCEHFTSAEDLPYNSQEGGYQYLHGGPYDPSEELSGEFSGVVPEEIIEEIATELSDEHDEWSGVPRPGDYDFDYQLDLAPSLGHAEEFHRSIGDIEKLLAVTITPNLDQPLIRMLFTNVVTSLETFLSDLFTTAVRTHPSLMRRFVETNPDFKEEKFILSDIAKIWEGLTSRVNDNLAETMWHNLPRVRHMYSKTLGITFMTDMAPLMDAIQIRHDCVHRNGRKKKGGDHTLTRLQVTELIARVRIVITECDQQWKDIEEKLKSATSAS